MKAKIHAQVSSVENGEYYVLIGYAKSGAMEKTLPKIYLPMENYSHAVNVVNAINGRGV